MTRTFVRTKFLFLSMACGVALVANGSPAIAELFDGGTSNPGDFNDPLNWNNDVLPGSNAENPEDAIVGSSDPAAVNPATANITGDLTIPTIGDFRVGNGNNGNGTVNQSAGEITPRGDKWSFVGADADGDNPAIGRYNLSGTGKFTHGLNDGDFNTGNFFLGLGGGRKDIAGGQQRTQGFLTVSDSAEFTVNNLFVGNNDDNLGQIDQSGGTVLANDWVSIGREGGAQGIYNMSGGSLAVTIDGITVGESSGAHGEFHLSGDATVNSGRLRVARNGDTTGIMSVTGNQVSVTVGFLDIGSNDGGLTSSEGILQFNSDGGVSSLTVLNDATLNDGSVEGFAKLEVDLVSSPPPAGDVLLIDVQGNLTGQFMGLPEGAMVPNSGGRTISYAYGDGNDVALIGVIPEPTAGLLMLLGGVAAMLRRARSAGEQRL